MTARSEMEVGLLGGYQVSQSLRNVIGANGQLIFQDAIKQSFEPTATMGFVDWVERHRFLPADCAMQGRFKFSECPYIREIGERLFDGSGDARIMAISKGAQLTFSEMLVNALLYNLSGAAGRRLPAMFLQATDDQIRTTIKVKIRPELQRDPLRRLVGGTGGRKSGNTLHEIIAPGCITTFSGGQSVNDFSTRTAGLVFPDEFPRMPIDVSGEGDPVSLLRGRISNFGNYGRIVAVGTPTSSRRDTGSFEMLLESGDRRHFFVPCPHCNNWDFFKIENFRVVKDEDGLVVDSYFECAACHGRQEERYKREMVQAGEWRPTKKPKYADVTSYMINGFYSLVGLTWSNIATEYESALCGDSSMKSFWNIRLGLGRNADVPDVEPSDVLEQTYENPDHLVPEDVTFLTAGVDIQDRFAVISVYGWKTNGKLGWSIRHVEIGGSFLKDDTKRRIDEFLRRSFVVAGTDGAERMHITVAMVDSSDGDVTNAVYEFCSHYDQPVLGETRRWRLPMDSGDPIVCPYKSANVLEESAIIHMVSKLKRQVGARHRSEMNLWRGGSNLVKAHLYKTLIIPSDAEGQVEGRVWFRAENSESFFREIVSEQPTEVKRKGGTVLHFTLPSGLTNEALDCYVMARVAAEVVWSSMHGVRSRGLSLRRRERADAEPAAAPGAGEGSGGEVKPRRRRRNPWRGE